MCSSFLTKPYSQTVWGRSFSLPSQDNCYGKTLEPLRIRLCLTQYSWDITNKSCSRDRILSFFRLAHAMSFNRSEKKNLFQPIRNKDQSAFSRPWDWLYVLPIVATFSRPRSWLHITPAWHRLRVFPRLALTNSIFCPLLRVLIGCIFLDNHDSSLGFTAVISRDQ